jgi:hypothetical protein
MTDFPIPLTQLVAFEAAAARPRNQYFHIITIN